MELGAGPRGRHESLFQLHGRYHKPATNMKPVLPAGFLAKASQYCRASSDPARVKLILKDGRIVYDVFVSSAGEFVKDNGRRVLGAKDLRFQPPDIADVLAY
jgi:hypothetical protein